MKKLFILLAFLALVSTNPISENTIRAASTTAINDIFCIRAIDENGNPIAGVSVFVKGTTRGTLTDIDGYACIEVYEGDTLVFSLKGYEIIEHVYEGEASATVVLRRD